FAPPQFFDGCAGATAIVVGQFNPATDSHLDVATICGGSELVGRMLGDGQGTLGSAQTVHVGYLGAAAGTGNSWITSINLLRLGTMDGPTLVYGGYIAATGQTTLCFLKVPDLELDLEHGGMNPPYCDIHTDAGNNITDLGPVVNDLAVGAVVEYPDEPVADEAVSGAVSGMIGSAEIPVA